MLTVQGILKILTDHLNTAIFRKRVYILRVKLAMLGRQLINTNLLQIILLIIVSNQDLRAKADLFLIRLDIPFWDAFVLDLHV